MRTVSPRTTLYRPSLTICPIPTRHPAMGPAGAEEPRFDGASNSCRREGDRGGAGGAGSREAGAR